MSLQYWDYFLSIESDLDKCSRYVEICDTNFSTYSIEFTRIIMAAAAEIDSVCKEFCKKIDPIVKPERINEYAKIILAKYPRLIEMESISPTYNISRKPFISWSELNSPQWWKDHNEIKHNRTDNFHKANLINTIDSVCALLILLLYYYYEKNNLKQEDIDLVKCPKMFNILGGKAATKMYPGRVVWDYELKV